MIKKDLLEFIERVEAKAVKSVNERFDKKISAKEIEVLSKYEDKINLLQDTFNRFSVNLSNLMADMREDKEVAFHGSWKINNGKEYLSYLKGEITSKCDFEGQVKKIENDRDKEINEVKANYHKVYTVAKNMSNAKKIADYLKELGFDISSIENKEATSLVADIDKSKLFVCGENK
jgi:hypothetical protein